MELEFVCMANSPMPGGRCVAGIRRDTGEWVRLVTNRQDESIPVHRTVTSQGEAQILDVIRAKVVRHTPQPYQPENWLIRGGAGLEFVRKLENRQAFVEQYLTEGPELLGSREASIPASSQPLLITSASLTIVEPQGVQWYLRPREGGLELQTRARFYLAGQDYDISVTDLVWGQRLWEFGPSPLSIEREYPVETDGYPASRKRYFVISRAKPFNSRCYKLVAGVIVP